MSKKNNNNGLQQKFLRLPLRNRGLVVIGISLLLILPALFVGLRPVKAYYSIDLPLPSVTDQLLDHMYTCVLDRPRVSGDSSTYWTKYYALMAHTLTIEQLYKDYFAIADTEAGGGGLDQNTFLDRAYRCLSFHEPDQSNFEEWDGLFEYYTHQEMVGFFQMDYGFTSIIKPRFLAQGPLQIALEAYRDGNREIYAMPFDGSSPARLTNNTPYVDGKPSWRWDRGKMAFETNRDGNDEIYSMTYDAASPTRLTNNLVADRSPSWSGDGSKIAFYSERDSFNREIYIMNANGSSQTRLTNDIYGYEDTDPKLSPDGTKIVFVSDRDGDKEIFVMDSDGTDQTQLTSNAVTDDDPDWSPDGTKIVFRSKRDSSAAEIYTMDSDGTDVVRLTTNSVNDASPNWSFDGTKIIFESKMVGSDYELWTMDSDGTNQTQLTDNSTDDVHADW